MEDVRTQARIPKSIEGVFSWATNVVQKKAACTSDILAQYSARVTPAYAVSR
jgi:hypothetical protein